MENIRKDFIIKKRPSPSDKPKSNDTIDLIMTQPASTVVATTESGGGGGKERKGHSSENIITPWKMVKISCGRGESKTQSFMPAKVNDSVQEPTTEMGNVKDSTKELADTDVICYKRKLSKGKGKVAIEKISQKGSLPYDPATPENEVNASNAQRNEVGPYVAQEKDVGHDAKVIRFDLNDPPIDEDEGGEIYEKVRGYEDSPPIHGLQGLDRNQQMEADKYSSNSATYETPAKEIEDECPILEKNDVECSPTKVFEFDLNELPTNEDEDQA